MRKISLKTSWLLVIIPLGILFFVVTPQIERTYTAFNNRQIKLERNIHELDSLKQVKGLKRRGLNKIKSLEISIPIHKVAFEREKFTYYKTGGMLVVLAFMGIGMVGFSYISSKKKSSSKNKEVEFTFEDPSNDVIGKDISWNATENSGSNFASEVYKKTRLGYTITSSSFTKVFAWSFFLIGLNYLVFSIIEFYQIGTKTMTFMQGGKLFFTSGGVFLIVGLFLILLFSPKVFIHTQKRKIIINGEVIPFQDVYALQVLEKFIEGKSSGGYHCYELNLVVKNGDRHNLLNHGDKDFVLSDMIKISRLFKVPVWNRGVV